MLVFTFNYNAFRYICIKELDFVYQLHLNISSNFNVKASLLCCLEAKLLTVLISNDQLKCVKTGFVLGYAVTIKVTKCLFVISETHYFKGAFSSHFAVSVYII